MSDVNDIAQVAEVAEAPEAPTVETETTQSDSQQTKQTAEPAQSAAREAQERMVPISVVQKERKERQELQRRLAEYEQKSKLSQYDENDVSAIMSHPFVQELLIKQAKSELTEFAKGTLDEHPEIPEPVKKAILTNVRGFVKETTTDVESAKIDIQEYIDSLVEQFPAQPVQPKTFPVASTTAKETVSGAKPMDVQQVLDKPVDEWSDDEAKLVDQYKKSMPKR